MTTSNISGLELYNDLMMLLNASPYERNKVFDQIVGKYLSLIDRKKLEEAYAKKMDLVSVLFRELGVYDIDMLSSKPYIIKVGFINVNVTALFRKVLRVYWPQFVSRFCNNLSLMNIFMQLLPNRRAEIEKDHRYFINQAIKNYLIAGLFAFPEKKDEIMKRVQNPEVKRIFQ
jgi:hypothetical protein